MLPEACLVVTSDPYCVPGAPVETLVGRTIALRPDTNVLGKSDRPDVTIRIIAVGVGRLQARIWRVEGEWFLEEMSVPYSVLINKRCIRPARTFGRAQTLGRALLNDRDTIGIGDHTFWFRIGTPWQAWRTPEVIALARCVSAERRFDALPILADALEEAGCNEEEVLKHCRTTRLGWRVSWVAELLYPPTTDEPAAAPDPGT